MNDNREQEEHKKQLLEIFDQQWNDQVKGGPHFEVFDTKRFIKGKSAQEIIYEALNTSSNKKRLLQEWGNPFNYFDRNLFW